MTELHAVALSLVPNLSRVGLTARLHQDDPELLDSATPYLQTAADVASGASRQGIGVVAWNSPHFPPLLLAMPDCPPALWFRGSLDALGPPAVAVVGSRAATAGGREIAAHIAAGLAAHGVTVVSGLARGVDSAAHRAALSRGLTVAVLGSGPDRIYPAEHGPLAAEIGRQGGVLSEYPPGTPPLPFHFPQRNRLISGLSRAVVVIEAAEGSGSLITAACALEQGRDVMVVPGNTLSGRNRGGHALIRDGALIVETVEDILGELGLSAGTARAVTTGERPVLEGQGRHQDPLLRVMDEGEPYDLDTLTAVLGVSGPRLLARLLELEIQGLIRRAGGGRFIRPGRTC